MAPGARRLAAALALPALLLAGLPQSVEGRLGGLPATRHLADEGPAGLEGEGEGLAGEDLEGLEGEDLEGLEGEDLEGEGLEGEGEDVDEGDDRLRVSLGPAGVEVRADGPEGRPWHHSVTSRHKDDPTQALVFGILNVVGAFGIGWWWRTKYAVPEQVPGSEATRAPEVWSGGGFSYGLCDEKEWWDLDFKLCACALFCWPIRWAETMTNEKVAVVGSFYVALGFALLGLDAWNQVDPLMLYPFGLAHTAFVAGAVYCRQKLRRKFGLSIGPLTIVSDALVWACCPNFLVAAQEARQVEHVRLPSEEEQARGVEFSRLNIPSGTYQPDDGSHLDTERTDTTVASDAPLMRQYENALNRAPGREVDPNAGL